MNHRKPILAMILFISLILLTNSVFASSAMWSQTYGGAQHEVAHWLIETSDNGYALGGYTRDVNEGEQDNDFLLVKIDSNGIMEWNQTYDLIKYGRIGSFIETSDGEYAVVAGNFWLIKTDSNGNIQSNKSYGSGSAYSLVETSDGGYALAGSTRSFGAGMDDFWLIKTDKYGNSEWNRTYGGARSDSAHSLTVTSDGGYALAGSFWSVNSSNPDFCLVKTDAHGNMEWNQTYDYNNWWESADYIFETSDGGYAIAGVAAFPPPLQLSYFWLIKTDAYGNMEWNKTYGKSEYEQAKSVVLTSDGGFAISGSKRFFDHGYHHDFWLIKTDADGNEEWSQTYGGSDNEIAHSLIETSDGGYAIAGESYALFGDGISDFLLMKTDEMGNIPEFPSMTILVLELLLITTISIIYRHKRIQENQK